MITEVDACPITGDKPFAPDKGRIRIVVDGLKEGLRLAEIAVRQGLSFDKETTEEIVANHVGLCEIRKALAVAEGKV